MSPAPQPFRGEWKPCQSMQGSLIVAFSEGAECIDSFESDGSIESIESGGSIELASLSGL